MKYEEFVDQCSYVFDFDSSFWSQFQGVHSMNKGFLTSWAWNGIVFLNDGTEYSPSEKLIKLSTQSLASLSGKGGFSSYGIFDSNGSFHDPHYSEKGRKGKKLFTFFFFFIHLFHAYFQSSHHLVKFYLLLPTFFAGYLSIKV